MSVVCIRVIVFLHLLVCLCACPRPYECVREYVLVGVAVFLRVCVCVRARKGVCVMCVRVVVFLRVCAFVRMYVCLLATFQSDSSPLFGIHGLRLA